MAVQTVTRSQIGSVLGVLLLLALLVYLIAGEYGVLHLIDLRREHAALQTHIRDAEEENQKLRREVDRLKRNPEYLEQVIRDEMGYVGPDDMIFVFDTPEANNP